MPNNRHRGSYNVDGNHSLDDGQSQIELRSDYQWNAVLEFREGPTQGILLLGFMPECGGRSGGPSRRAPSQEVVSPEHCPAKRMPLARRGARSSTYNRPKTG